MDVAEAVEQVADGLNALAGVDLDVLSDPELNETLIALQRLSHRLGAQACRFAHRWEQRGVWCGDGSKSSAARLGRDGRTAQHSARTVLLRGRGLDEMPLVAAAFAAGTISTDQVDLLLAAHSDREYIFARDEEMLVAQACSLRVAELAKTLRYWRHRADTELGRDDGTEPAAPTATLSFTPIEGAVAVDGELDPVGGQIVITAIDAIADELAAADRLSGRERTRPQLRAAALVEMARRAMATPADGRPARILANIACGHDAFTELCELANGTIIRPGHLVPYLDALDIRSIVFDSATHAVATSSRRTFAGSLRGVIEVRDVHCQHPSGCDEPIDRCDVDHIIPWSQGGQTSQDNGRLLCQFHNRIEPQYARPPDDRPIYRLDFADLRTTNLTDLLRPSLN